MYLYIVKFKINDIYLVICNNNVEFMINVFMHC